MAQQLGSNYYNSPFKFNGKELDEETGFYYYGARYYDPKISIWLSTDPLAEKFPNFNPYNYVMQNPLNLIDPTGMAPEEGGGDPGKKGWFDIAVDTVKGWFSSSKPKSKGSVEVGPVTVLDNGSDNINSYSLIADRQVKGGYPGQALEELVVKGIELLGEQITQSDVSTETSNNVNLGLSILAVVVTKGKNKAADKNLIENIVSDGLPNVVKAVNSNLPHAIEQGIARGVFANKTEASTMLKSLTSQISKSGFPAGAFKDPSYLDRVLVPIGNGGLAAYQVAKNGTAAIKTILIAK